MIALAALGFLACGETGTTVIAHVDAMPGLDGITRLRLTARNGGSPRTYDLVPPNPKIPPAIDIAIHVPPAARGTFEVAIDAFAGDTRIGHAENMLELVPGKATTLMLTFGEETQPDLAGADLSGDLLATVVDLVGRDLLGADLVALPDLAVADDLAPLPDLVPPLQPLVIAPSPWSFGTVDEGASSAAKSFTVQNQTPNASMGVTVTSPDTQFVVDVGTCGLNLAGNSVGTCSFSVTFTPNGSGPRSADIVVDAVTHRGVVTVSGIAKGGLGDACVDDGHCKSGNCVDGFCCNTTASSCSGCNACNVATKEGTCSPVPLGSDPKNFCTQVCANKCDGAGACKPAAAGTVCQTEMCANQAASFFQWSATTSGIHECDGVVTTCPVATAPCAGKLVCDTGSGSCDGGCTTDAECLDGFFCNGTTCEAVRNAGAACSRGVQCFSKKCNGATCESTCVNNLGCYPGGPICHNPGSGKGCFYCTRPGGPTLSCSGSGWGNTCVTDGSGYGYCTCANDTECNDQAPTCATATTWLTSPNKFCACNTSGAGSSYCLAWQQCTNPGATGQCKNRPGWPCVLASQCASNVCSNGLCG